MNKKYIVKTQGRVFDVQDKAYEVVARNKNEAETIAKNMFIEEYPVIDAQINTKASGISFATAIAIVTLIAAILPTFIRWVNGHDVISLRPTMLSCLYAIALYSGYLVRFKGIPNMFHSWTDAVFCPLLVLLFSSFVQALFSTTTLKFFGFTLPFDSKTLLMVSVLLSWLGFRFMSVVCTVVLFLLSIGNLLGLDAAMGSIFGPIYIICSFIGLVSYMSTEPAFHQGVLSFGNNLGRSAGQFKNDFDYAKDVVKDKSSEIADKVKNG